MTGEDKRRDLRKLSDSELAKVTGGAAAGSGFVVGCNDCDFSALYDASSYEAASEAAAAHEKATGHIVFIGFQD